MLTKIGAELANTIQGAHTDIHMQADESFSFLRQLDADGNPIEFSVEGKTPDSRDEASDMASAADADFSGYTHG